MPTNSKNNRLNKRRIGRDRRDQGKIDLPDLYLCPLTNQIMRDPVSFDNEVYERDAIELRLKHQKTETEMNALLESGQLKRVDKLKKMIDRFLENNRHLPSVRSRLYMPKQEQPDTDLLTASTKKEDLLEPLQEKQEDKEKLFSYNVSNVLEVSINKNDSINQTVLGKPKEKTMGELSREELAAIRLAAQPEIIVKYLVGFIQGIGEKKAQEMVEQFGNTVFDVLDEVSEKLISPWFKGKRIETITQSWEIQKKDCPGILCLLASERGLNMVQSLYKRYQGKMNKVLKTNPYRLLTDANGLLYFHEVEKIATCAGFDKHAIERIQAGVTHILHEAERLDGECALTSEALVKKTADLLELPERVVWNAIELSKGKTIMEETTINQQQLIFSRKMHRAEEEVTRHLLRLIRAKKVTPDNSTTFPIADEFDGITLSDEQKQAIESVIRHKVLCIVGEGGVGKTTIVSALLQILNAQNKQVTLCAPTGRAAQRLLDITGSEAYTIHRLLAPNRQHNTNNKPNPLKADFFIIDEASMLDVMLMSRLLRTLPDHAGLLIIGDANQLSAVGAGSVLEDIIRSDILPVVTLSEIFRQTAHSQILFNARNILRGEMLQPSIDRDSDFQTIHCKNKQSIETELKALLTKKLTKKITTESINTIQILTPMREGHLGTHYLNKQLQAWFNPEPTAHIMHKNQRLGVGDKVMQIINNYDKGVFNGETGIIQSVCSDQSNVTVKFKKEWVTYTLQELKQIELAYAITIHKSQGSQYPVVIITLAQSHNRMLERRLIYTAVTRAQQQVFLIAEPEAIAKSINQIGSCRLTGLAEKLKSGFEKSSVPNRQTGKQPSLHHIPSRSFHSTSYPSPSIPLNRQWGNPLSPHSHKTRGDGHFCFFKPKPPILPFTAKATPKKMLPWLRRMILFR